MNFEHFIAAAERNLFIIAEAGVNHDGRLDLALQLVDAAVQAGCDAIKFQTFITEQVYSRAGSLKPRYQASQTPSGESAYDMIRRLELPWDHFREIKVYCDRRGIRFFSTPDEMDSARFLRDLGVSLLKIASPEVTNLPYLSQLASLGLPVIFSTGACTWAELVSGAEAIRAVNDQLIILHCVSAYPAPLEDLNLLVIPKLIATFGCPVGFSDHTTGAEAACTALGLGARVFEKHLTLDRTMPGPDHQASLEPGAMGHYVKVLRDQRAALGNGNKRVMASEEDTRSTGRRFIVARRNLRRGQRISPDDLCFKKVIAGLEPARVDLVLGATLKLDVPADTTIALSQLDFSDD